MQLGCVSGHRERRQRLHRLQRAVRQARLRSPPEFRLGRASRPTGGSGHLLGALPTDVYMCHGFCELGAIRFSTVARQIHSFLEREPPSGPGHRLRGSPLLGAYRRRAPHEWSCANAPPRRGRTAAPHARRDDRFGDSCVRDAGERRRRRDARTCSRGWAEETPFTFVRPSALQPRDRAPPSGATTRAGLPVQPLADASASLHREPGELEVVSRRAGAAMRGRSGPGPTLVAVDFAERGALLPIVDELNGK